MGRFEVGEPGRRVPPTNLTGPLPSPYRKVSCLEREANSGFLNLRDAAGTGSLKEASQKYSHRGILFWALAHS